MEPIPSDPAPSSEALAAVREDLVRRGHELRRIDRRYLVLQWRLAVQERDPSAFHVPFRPDEIDYPAYLASATWARIREAVLLAADHRCAGCGAEATQVHHRDYRPCVMIGADLSPLVALCADCHAFVHERPEGEWRPWDEEDADLVALVADYDQDPARTTSLRSVPAGDGLSSSASGRVR